MKPFIFIFVLLLTSCSEAPKEQAEPVKKQRVKTSDITFEFPVVIKAENLFKFDVKIPHSGTITSAKLTGISMDMGIVPLIFKTQDKSNTHYQADVFLGACALPIMKWRLEIVWVVNGQTKYADQSIAVIR